MFMSRTEYVISVGLGCSLEVIPRVDNFNTLSPCILNKRNLKNRPRLFLSEEFFLRLPNPKAIL